MLVLLAGSASASIPTPPPATPTPPRATCVAPYPSPGDVCCSACPTTHTCVTAQGGPGCFDVAAAADCCWSAVALSGFGLTLTGAAEGCGNGQVCYDVTPYLGDIGRVFEVQVGDEVYRVGQSRPGTVTPNRTPSATPTPTVSPCVEYAEERLEFDFAIEPAAPRVGDDVTLTFHVRNTTSGLAGIPTYGVFTAPCSAARPRPRPPA
jgi:hypothetical protein